MNVLIYARGIDMLPDDMKLFFCADNIKTLESVFKSYLVLHESIPDAVVDVEISLSFLTKDDIAKVNADYRMINEPTDVLSFPMWESENADFSPPDDWDILPLGDILLCPEIIERNAIDNSKKFKEELILVISHGFLHLIGYDHAADDARDIMWGKQDALVEDFFRGITASTEVNDGK